MEDLIQTSLEKKKIFYQYMYRQNQLYFYKIDQLIIILEHIKKKSEDTFSDLNSLLSQIKTFFKSINFKFESKNLNFIKNTSLKSQGKFFDVFQQIEQQQNVFQNQSKNFKQKIDDHIIKSKFKNQTEKTIKLLQQKQNNVNSKKSLLILQLKELKNENSIILRQVEKEIKQNEKNKLIQNDLLINLLSLQNVFLKLQQIFKEYYKDLVIFYLDLEVDIKNFFLTCIQSFQVYMQILQQTFNNSLLNYNQKIQQNINILNTYKFDNQFDINQILSKEERYFVMQKTPQIPFSIQNMEKAIEKQLNYNLEENIQMLLLFQCDCKLLKNKKKENIKIFFTINFVFYIYQITNNVLKKLLIEFDFQKTTLEYDQKQSQIKLVTSKNYLIFSKKQEANIEILKNDAQELMDIYQRFKNSQDKIKNIRKSVSNKREIDIQKNLKQIDQETQNEILQNNKTSQKNDENIQQENQKKNKIEKNQKILQEEIKNILQPDQKEISQNDNKKIDTNQQNKYEQFSTNNQQDDTSKNQNISLEKKNKGIIMYPSSRQGNNLYNNLNQGLNTGLRAPTGYRQNKIVNTLGYNTNLNISERPVTQHGMLGMKTVNSGPKRKILSRSYFLVLLKQKIEELTNEIARFRNEKELREKEKVEYAQYLKKNEVLSEEVKELEGTLSDYNMAFDKQRAGIKPEDVYSVYQHLNFQNQKFRSEIDLIFVERKNYEDKIISIQQQIDDLKNYAQIKINELNIDEREEFRKLELQVKEAEQSNKINMKKLEELNKHLVEQETKLRMDQTRNKVFELKESIESKTEIENKLQVELKDQSLSFEDLRKKLMQDVKIHKQSIQNFEKKLKESKKLTKMTYKKLQKVDDLLNGNGIDENQKQKYEILYAKEQEVEQNIMQNKEKIEKRSKMIEELEQQNLVLLQKVSKNKHSILKAPERKDLQDINNEYQYKKEQAQNSEQTLVRVQQELLRRQQDLKKVDEIEETLPMRIKELESLFITLKEQIEYYNNKDQEKEKLVQRIENLNKKIQIIDENKSNIEQEYKEAENDYRRKLKNLQSHPLFKKFIKSEKDLSQINQLKFSLQNYVRTQENEMNYQSAVQTIEQLTNIINETLCSKK